MQNVHNKFTVVGDQHERCLIAVRQHQKYDKDRSNKALRHKADQQHDDLRCSTDNMHIGEQFLKN